MRKVEKIGFESLLYSAYARTLLSFLFSNALINILVSYGTYTIFPRQKLGTSTRLIREKEENLS